MTNTVLLDNVAHHDLRVLPGFSDAFGDGVNMAIAFPTEFVWLQREYPIVFRRDEQEGLQAVVLLGLDRGDNLFLDGNGGWNARYVPAVQRRGPFLVGLHGDGDGSKPPEAKVHVDLDHPKVSRSEGEPLFLEHGGQSPLLQRMTRVLQLIVQGTELAGPMFAAFESEGLLEPLEMKASLADGTEYTISGFLGIDAERLAGLDGAALERLHTPGWLNLAFMVSNSLGNIEWLIELKNRKQADAAS